MEKGRYSGKMLIGSILAGVIYAIIGEVLYRSLQDIIPGIPLICIYFFGLFLFIGLSIWGLGKLAYSRYYKPVLMKQWVRVALAMLILSLVFEFLYEIQFKEEAEPVESYVFILDNSGSMEGSDPRGARFDAVEKLLEDKSDDFQYAVYTFADSPQLVRKMAVKGNGIDYERGENNGGTAILKTLRQVLSDIENNTLKLASGRTHIILLSDGYASDISFLNKYQCIALLKKYAKRDISISTVGMLSADKDLMSLIATKTGGVFVNVDNINDLDAAVAKAGETSESKWDLLSYRDNLKFGVIYAIMRILFVTVLGALVGLQKAIVCEKFLDTTAVINSSIVGSVLAGICIEIGMNGFGIYPTIIRVLVCVLISFTLLKEDFKGMNSAGAEVYRGI